MQKKQPKRVGQRRKRKRPSNLIDPSYAPSLDIDVALVAAKPRLESVLFVEYANQTADGKTNLIGVFDRLFIDRATKESGTFFLFVRTSETHKGVVEIVLVDPNSKPRLGVRFDGRAFPFAEPNPYPRLMQFLDRVAFRATIEGTYWAHVTYEGKALGGAPLTVEWKPKEKGK